MQVCIVLSLTYQQVTGKCFFVHCYLVKFSPASQTVVHKASVIAGGDCNHFSKGIVDFVMTSH